MDSTADLPEAHRAAALERIRHYIVNLLVPGDEGSSLCGSGTLVQCEGGSYILTAAHVWEQLRREREGIIVLSAYLRNLSIGRALIGVHCTEREEDAWGPDAALIKLPDARVQSLLARHSFHALRLGEAARPTSGAFDGMRVLVGTPDEATFTDERSTRRFNSHCFFGELEGMHTRAAGTYYDVRILPSDRQVDVQDFGGVSGGGLWAVQVAADASGDLVATAELRGVAFYQLPGTRTIRCQCLASLLPGLLASELEWKK